MLHDCPYPPRNEAPRRIDRVQLQGRIGELGQHLHQIAAGEQVVDERPLPDR